MGLRRATHGAAASALYSLHALTYPMTLRAIYSLCTHRFRELVRDAGLDGAPLGRCVRRDEDEARAVELVHGDGAERHVGDAHLLPHLVRVRVKVRVRVGVGAGVTLTLTLTFCRTSPSVAFISVIIAITWLG